jgi:DNA-binding MarR family transcriptional regulator
MSSDDLRTGPQDDVGEALDSASDALDEGRRSLDEGRRALDDALRALRRVTLQGTVFGQSVAIRLGLSDSDVEALEALLDSGASTAGRLGEILGLSTGAVTRLVDRLEQAGYVRRIPDPVDRRRVVVEVLPDKAEAVRSMLSRVASAGSAELGRFTDQQLDVVADFLSQVADVTREEATRLRESDAPGAGEPTRGEHAAPRGDLTEARLLFRSGAARVTLHAASRVVDLYQARFEGAVPRVTVRDGTVSIQYRGFSWGKRSADIALNPSVGWRVEVQGGASDLAGRLDGVDLRGFEVMGGASRVDLAVGRPHGHVAIRIVGGASRLRLERPVDVAVRLHINGGAGRLELDGQRIGAQGGLVRLDSPGAPDAADRYDVEIVGGAGRLVVERRR